MPIKSNSSPSKTNGQTSMSTSSVIATVEGALASVSHEFHNFVDDVEHLIKETSSLTGEELEQARAKLNERIAMARDTVEQTGGALTKHARKSIAAGNKYAHQQPWQIIGAGVAAGLLIGLALAHRR